MLWRGFQGTGHRAGEGSAPGSIRRRRQPSADRPWSGGQPGADVQPPLIGDPWILDAPDATWGSSSRHPRSTPPTDPSRVDVTRLEWWDLTKRILIVLSEFGYWGEELVGPLETFDEAGYEVDFATPKGKRPDAARRRAWTRSTSTRRSASPSPRRRWPTRSRRSTPRSRYDKPIDISAWIPERPYWSRRPSCATGGLLRPARRGREGDRRQVRRDPARRRQRPDRRHRQQRADPRPDPAASRSSTSRSARSATASPCLAFARDLGRTARASSPASTSPATARSTTTRTARASSGSRTSTWARRRTRSSTSCATRPLPAASTTATRPRDVGHRRLPVHHRPLDARTRT